MLANFTCMGTGDVLEWTVGSNSVTDPSNQDREISVTTNNILVDVWSSVLSIRALPINNGISVACNVININPYGFKKKGATLTIEGMCTFSINYGRVIRSVVITTLLILL